MIFKKVYTDIPENIVCTQKNTFIGLNTDYHSHDNYEIYLLLNGETNLFFDKQAYHMIRGKGVFIKSNVFHRFEYLDQSIYNRINIHIKDSYFNQLNTSKSNLAQILDSNQSRSHAIFTLSETQIHEFTQECNELEKNIHEDCYGNEIFVESLLRLLLVKINRISQDKNQSNSSKISIPPLVSSVISYIHENLTKDLSLSTLGILFHHNGNYISRCFKNSLGISLQQYIIFKKIDIAKEYLASGYSILDVCFLCGYKDYSNFAKIFSKHVGQSPKQYQKKILNN